MRGRRSFVRRQIRTGASRRARWRTRSHHTTAWWRPLTPHDFIRVAEAMEELGRDEDVLLWAKRGIAETSGWQVAQLYELIAGVLRRGGLRREVVELRHDQHQHMPSASTYALLKDWHRRMEVYGRRSVPGPEPSWPTEI